jgi:hypothetical protein
LPTGTNSRDSDGEFNQLLQIDVGVPIKLFSIPGYVKTHVRYNNGNKGFSDEIRYGAEVDFSVVNKKLWISGKLDILNSAQNGTLDPTNSGGSIFANNIEYTSIGGEAANYITKKQVFLLAMQLQ